MDDIIADDILGFEILGVCLPLTIDVEDVMPSRLANISARSSTLPATILKIVSVNGNEIYDPITNPKINMIGYIYYDRNYEEYRFQDVDQTRDGSFLFAPCSGIINLCPDIDVTVYTLAKGDSDRFKQIILNFTPYIPVMYLNGFDTQTSDDWQTELPNGCSPLVPCISPGQNVLTPSGNKLIDDLVTGDLIVTPDGRHVEIIMSEMHIPVVTSCNAPYLIPAGTFGENLPPNDLSLSPDHVLMIKPGVWDVPKHLANVYSNITRTNMGETFKYYNIETPNYLTDDIIVEGTVIESYGKSFAEKYPEHGDFYKYSDELGGYTRITMDDLISFKSL